MRMTTVNPAFIMPLCSNFNLCSNCDSLFRKSVVPECLAKESWEATESKDLLPLVNTRAKERNDSIPFLPSPLLQYNHRIRHGSRPCLFPTRAQLIG